MAHPQDPKDREEDRGKMGTTSDDQPDLVAPPREILSDRNGPSDPDNRRKCS